MIDMKYFCDGCGSRITSDRTVLTVEAGPLRRWAESIDLCSPCAQRFQEWLDAGHTLAPAEASPVGLTPSKA